MPEIAVALIGVVVGFALNAGWEWWRYQRQEHRERTGFRTLLSVELLQNLTGVEILRGAASYTLDYVDARDSAVQFLVATPLPQWQTTRWTAPEAGRYLKPSELMRLGEFYTKLDGLALLYQRLITQLQHLPTNSNGTFAIDSGIADEVVRQIQNLIAFAEDLVKNPPPLPDTKLNSGESIPDYLADLRQRQPKAQEAPAVPDASEPESTRHG